MRIVASHTDMPEFKVAAYDVGRLRHNYLRIRLQHPDCYHDELEGIEVHRNALRPLAEELLRIADEIESRKVSKSDDTTPNE